MSVDPRRSVEVGDPIEYFLEDQAYHGKTERTIAAYERVLREFERFLTEEGREPTDPREATQRECMAWIHTLRGEHAESTIATYASYLHRFYAYMTQIGAFEFNPMTLVVEEMPERIEANPTRRDVSVEGMRTFLGGISHPLERAAVLTLLKTGIRVGELCNLDCRDLRLTDPPEYASIVPPRAQLSERPDTLFVSPRPSKGAKINGEVRSASNKRQRETVVPVDVELRTELLTYLAIRPDTLSPAEPLFVDTGASWGQRLEPTTVRSFVERHARANGWHHTGGDAAENVTPHYFRHFFTTHLRDRTGDRGIVKYLRGDVADDIIDTYTHNWGDRVHEVYHDNIYLLV